MKTINLRDFYRWYVSDEFVDVSDEVYEALVAYSRYENAYTRRVYYHKAHYSLDRDDGIENEIVLHTVYNLEEEVVEREQYCLLCQSLNSLPEKLGRRIEARFIGNKKLYEIAEDEGVTESAISLSISWGLEKMREKMNNPNFALKTCP